MKKKLVLIMSVLMALCLLLSACGGSSSSEAPAAGSQSAATATSQEAAPDGELMKIAYVTSEAGLGDKSFNDRGYEGMQRLMDAGVVDVTVVEPKESAEKETILRNLSATGEYALIIGMSGDMVDAMTVAAELYPDQKFVVVDGLAGVDNIRAIYIQTSNAGLLNGCLSALLERDGILPNAEANGVIGVIGGMDIPAVRSSVMAYTAGAKYINPDLEVLVNYVGSFTDPTTASEQTQAMYDRGASIVFAAAGSSGLGVFEAAQASNRYSLGASSNQNDLAPDNIIASAARAIDTYLENTVYDLLDGKFEGGDFPIGIGEDPEAIVMVYEGSNVEVPDYIKEELNQIKLEMAEILKTVALPTDLDEVETFLAEVGTYSAD